MDNIIFLQGVCVPILVINGPNSIPSSGNEQTRKEMWVTTNFTQVKKLTQIGRPALTFFLLLYMFNFFDKLTNICDDLILRLSQEFNFLENDDACIHTLDM